MRPLLLACAAFGLCGCAHSPIDDPSDPLEPVNRGIYSFNDKLDKYVAQPVAKGYVHAVPAVVRTGVSNFLSNATYLTVVINDVLQGKLGQAGHDTGRFLLNTTFGLGGVLDPATLVGLEKNDEDFGQTLGKWGVGEGWYLMLPFLGPSTNRDLVGRVANSTTSPWPYVDNNYSFPVTVLGAVDARAGLLGVEDLLKEQYDPYAFIRSAYLQRRQSLVYDGNPPREEIDYGE
ncbi:MAG TPA: VacJ family lipoprotein [Solimonas sp.]|nr:VacJ family lipoprotein [Solimonas sp.]